MAEGKKSFVLYCDLKHTVDLLDDASAGKLLKHLLRYVNDENPETTDTIVKIAFEPIKQQLKRDLKDWEDKKYKRADAGHLGGIKSGESRRNKKIKANEANASKTKQCKANEAVTVNGTVTVNVNDTHITEKNGFFKPDENYKLVLSENDVGKTIEYITHTKHVSANREMVFSIWEVFKAKNFTGEKPYKNDKDIFRHFFESLKFVKIDGTGKKTNGTVGKTIEFDRP
jgi:hypothetical protein